MRTLLPSARASQLQEEVDVYYVLYKRRSPCDYKPTELHNISRTFACTYEVKLPKGTRTLESAACRLTNITDPIKGHQQIREFILDHSIYVNQDTRINFINEGEIKFEECQTQSVRISFNIISSTQCVIAYGLRSVETRQFWINSRATMREKMKTIEATARKEYEIPPTIEVYLVYRDGLVMEHEKE